VQVDRLGVPADEAEQRKLADPELAVAAVELGLLRVAVLEVRVAAVREVVPVVSFLELQVEQQVRGCDLKRVGIDRSYAAFISLCVDLFLLPSVSYVLADCLIVAEVLVHALLVVLFGKNLAVHPRVERARGRGSE
jgi:hypothetical protein